MVVRCYTPLLTLKEHKTVDLSSRNVKFSEIKRKKEKSHSKTSFKDCYGMLQSLSNSITIKAPTELRVASDGENYSYEGPSNHFGKVIGDHSDDFHFDHGDCFITKLGTEWQFEEKTGAKFLYARHIQNTTFMNIPSGAVSFKNGHDAVIFNYIPRLNISYDIGFLHPLVSLHLLEEKKLIVETYVDKDKFIYLKEKTLDRSFFNGNFVKLSKIDARQKAKKSCPFRIGKAC